MSANRTSILLFDGVCKFCHASVQFVIRRDKNNKFMFCPIQNRKGQHLMQQFSLGDSGLTSMILLQDSQAYRKSDAALHITRELPMPWPLLYGFIILPKFIRDRIYDFIGNHRYQWFGKYDSCWIPNDETRKKFIDQDD